MSILFVLIILESQPAHRNSLTCLARIIYPHTYLQHCCQNTVCLLEENFISVNAALEFKIHKLILVKIIDNLFSMPSKLILCTILFMARSILVKETRNYEGLLNRIGSKELPASTLRIA